MRILVVEDDSNIAQLIESILEDNNYVVDLAIDGEGGLDLSAVYEYDAILLDISLPKKDGVSVCQEIRAKGNTVPILLLTGLDSPADRARGLDAGADDYLGKPFDPDELLARIRAILRRSHAPSLPVLTWGNLQLDPVSATVTFADQLVPVTPKEYALLELFLHNSKRVFSCSAILDRLWSYDVTPGEEAIRTHIKGLRQKLKQVGAAPDVIETVYGIGYRLKPVNLPSAALLNDAWEKFRGQVQEQVAVLEQLAVRFINRDLQVDWQSIGQNIAHSLTGSLGTFGFSLSSELSRQIEKLLSGNQELTLEQGQRLFALVTALKEELKQPIVMNDVYSFEPDTATDILLVSTDADFNQAIRSAAYERNWSVQIVSSIAAARSQLRKYRTRSIVLTSGLVDDLEQVLRLQVEVSKQVPVVPILALTNAEEFDSEVPHLGNYLSICPTSMTDLMQSIEQIISTAESSQIRVLVVDDDLKILAILPALLSPWGLKITTLSDPQKFWEVLPKAQPDLVILDVEMPIVSGLELCKSIRNHADWSNLPIIFLTAHLESNIIQQVFATGADDFVTKPLVGPELVSRITNLMERQQVQKLKIERQRVDQAQTKLGSKKQIQTMLEDIEQALEQENISQAQQQIEILRQLLLKMS
jgi:DNA-binding response OmpR family regulator